jgi:hypothetical protein
MQPLRLFNESASLELHLLQADEDPYLNVVVSSNGFSGKNDLYVFGEAFKSFCTSLRSLEVSLKGEATLESISPNELQLKLYNANGRGHIAVTGSTGCWIGFGEEQFWHSVAFGFIIDPQQLTSAMALPWIREG